jgi:hypothetical protein
MRKREGGRKLAHGGFAWALGASPGFAGLCRLRETGLGILGRHASGEAFEDL